MAVAKTISVLVILKWNDDVISALISVYLVNADYWLSTIHLL